MTHSQILALPAGEEMDRLVAALMGRPLPPKEPLPFYSQEMNYAFSVFDRFPHIVLQRASSPDGSMVGYRCSIPDYSGDRIPGTPVKALHAEADTIPLAICRCALLTTIKES